MGWHFDQIVLQNPTGLGGSENNPVILGEEVTLTLPLEKVSGSPIEQNEVDNINALEIVESTIYIHNLAPSPIKAQKKESKAILNNDECNIVVTMRIPIDANLTEGVKQASLQIMSEDGQVADTAIYVVN
ncbi:hypothetical protein J8M21_24655 [Pseudoalteromonas luteoviolacea]|uniref:hypothetical protein n=1 Tax=Pseudoalteromonas luteoviolacea TaxID=43657 RepID=UPI001B3A7612|nr:hypothetical protein [Pseudoalteromonas luteoviolacea]MBQ4880394.1 hypothetical protein [Pseudoalteromonas luteoviolacea]MBQ4909458.1 hypothetical protein [Pseudoalteromonas luteoviolacea]